MPGVVAVLTAADLAPLKLHWMPTLAGDVQMVLADGKVLFQNQEIAFVVATRPAKRRPTRAELVEVEYEELPNPWSIRSRRWTPTRRCCAKTWKARPPARTARANTTTTSSNGRSATARPPTSRSVTPKSRSRN